MSKAVLSYTATAEDNNKTVEVICRKKLFVSAGLLTVLKTQNSLLLNGKPCRTVDVVSENDIVTVDVSENDPNNSAEAVHIPIEIIYEDEFLIAVNKPRKMSVHESPGNYGTTLANAVAYHLQRNGENCRFHAINRLDKDTSGICLIAKNRFAHSAVCNFKKKYMAIVHGSLPKEFGTVALPIKRDSDSIIKRVTAPDGKPAVTHYTVLSCKNNMSLVDIELETGRTHQIRVHMSAVGCPLVGDWLYGKGDLERHLAKGHLLHAYEISFTHPSTRETIVLKTPLPSDMKELFPG